jgi:hypothetical protein
MPKIGEHFGLESFETNELFDAEGCNNAQTSTEAADYIEAFAARKWPEPQEQPEMVALKASLTAGDSVASTQMKEVSYE